jgi:hypothetical protein
MTIIQQIEKAFLTLAVVGIVAALIFVGKVDATSGLAYIIAAAGLNLTGTLAGNQLGQLTAATGSKAIAETPPASVPVIPTAAELLAAQRAASGDAAP